MQKVNDILENFYNFISLVGIRDLCDVTINKQDHWYVISGIVNSFNTKGILFDFIPEHGGAKWIVDKVHIGQLN